MLVQTRDLVRHVALVVQAVPAFDELLSQTLLTLTQTVAAFAAVQARPLDEQVPLPDAGQLPAPPALVLVQAVPVLLQVPLKLQLFGAVLQAAPAAVPPQRLVVAQTPVAVQSTLVMLHLRETAGHAVTEQSAPEDEHFLSVGHAVAALATVQAAPVELQVPAVAGQLALVAQAALVTLHLPLVIGVHAPGLLVQLAPEMLHFELQVVVSAQGLPSGSGGSRLQPAGTHDVTQVALSTLQVWFCVVMLQVWFCALQVCVVVLQVCAVPAPQVCATAEHAGCAPLQTCVVRPLQVCVVPPAQAAVVGTGQVPFCVSAQVPVVVALHAGVGTLQ